MIINISASKQENVCRCRGHIARLASKTAKFIFALSNLSRQTAYEGISKTNKAWSGQLCPVATAQHKRGGAHKSGQTQRPLEWAPLRGQPISLMRSEKCSPQVISNPLSGRCSIKRLIPAADPSDTRHQRLEISRLLCRRMPVIIAIAVKSFAGKVAAASGPFAWGKI